MLNDEQIRAALADIGVDQVQVEDFMQVFNGQQETIQPTSTVNTELELYYKMESAEDWRTRARYAAKIVGLNYE